MPVVNACHLECNTVYCKSTPLCNDVYGARGIDSCCVVQPLLDCHWRGKLGNSSTSTNRKPPSLPLPPPSLLRYSLPTQPLSLSFLSPCVIPAHRSSRSTKRRTSVQEDFHFAIFVAYKHNDLSGLLTLLLSASPLSLRSAVISYLPTNRRFPSHSYTDAHTQTHSALASSPLCLAGMLMNE